MRFEWDPAKAEKNRKKHKVSFEEACTIFYDPLAITGDDPDHSLDDERMITFGVSSSNRLLVVAHVVRGDIIRIISARLVTRHERRIYEEG